MFLVTWDRKEERSAYAAHVAHHGYDSNSDSTDSRIGKVDSGPAHGHRRLCADTRRNNEDARICA